MRDDSRYCTSSHLGRPQSPKIEHAFEDALAAAVKEICETRGLYQNVDVVTDVLSDVADDKWTQQSLTREFSRRPVQAITRKEHVSIGSRIYGGRLGGTDALGTPPDEMLLAFYLPVAEIACARCKQTTPHTSVPAPPLPHETPFAEKDEKTVQVLHVLYGCTRCGEEVIAFQIMRRGLRLQLTGRTSPFRPPIDKAWPKTIRDIVRDAFVASAEGDIPAAYYHLRTAQEFFMKNEVGLDPSVKIEGKELCDAYNKTADPRVVRDFPAMSTLYIKLSEGLHSRNVTIEDFEACTANFLKHLKAKSLFEELKT
jgi:hypothetical protein